MEQGEQLAALGAAATRAMVAIGHGLLSHPGNGALRIALADPDDPFDAGALHRELQFVVHRHVVHLAAAAQHLLPEPAVTDWQELRSSTARLAGVSAAVGPAGDLPVLGGRLWDPAASRHVDAAELAAADLAPLLALGTAAVDDDPAGNPLGVTDVGVEALGAVHEALLGVVPVVDPAAGTFGTSALGDSVRSAGGSFYTPRALVDEVLDHALDPVVDVVLAGEPDGRHAGALLALRVCDPACGAGSFLVSVVRRLADHVAEARHRGGDPLPFTIVRQQALHDVATRCVFGADLDPVAVALTETALWLEVGDPNLAPSRLSPRLVVGDALAGAWRQDLVDGIPARVLHAVGDDDRDAVRALRRADATRAAAADAATPVSADPARLVALADAWSAVALAPRRDTDGSALVDRFHDLRDGVVDPVEAPPPDRALIHWELAFPGLAEQDGPGLFDVVVGNPPFLRGRDHGRLDPRGRNLLTARHDACSGSTWNLWVPFVLLAARLARRRSAMVVQSSVLGSQYAAGLHASLLERHGIARVLDLSQVPGLFPDAAVQVASLVVTRGRTASTRFLRYGADVRVEVSVDVAAHELGALPPGYWTLPTSGLGAAERSCLLAPPVRLRDIATIHDGMEQSAAYAVAELVGEERGDRPEVRLLPTGLVEPHHDLWGRRATRFLGTRHQRPVIAVDQLEASGQVAMLEQARSAKVAVAGLASRIEAVVDEGTALVSKSAYVVRPTDADVCPWALAVVLNAAVTNELHDAAFGALGFGAGSRNYRPASLGWLPMPARAELAPDDGTPGRGHLSRLGRALHHAHGQGAPTTALVAEADALVRDALGLGPV